MRRTFFAQFVPGESVAECRPVMEDLRRREVGSVLNYSAEAEVDKGAKEGLGEVMRRLERERLEEVERALDGAGEFERVMEMEGRQRGSTAFALKVVRFSGVGYQSGGETLC